jgi:hypothetical protein
LEIAEIFRGHATALLAGGRPFSAGSRGAGQTGFADDAVVAEYLAATGVASLLAGDVPTR